MAFDTKCYELAEYFTEEALVPERTLERLAQTLQDTIDDFLGDEDNFPPPEPPDEWRNE